MTICSVDRFSKLNACHFTAITDYWYACKCGSSTESDLILKKVCFLCIQEAGHLISDSANKATVALASYPGVRGEGRLGTERLGTRLQWHQLQTKKEVFVEL